MLNPGNSSSITVITKGATVPPQYPGKRVLPLAFRPEAPLTNQSGKQCHLSWLTDHLFPPVEINGNFTTNLCGRELHRGLFELKRRCHS